MLRTQVYLTEELYTQVLMVAKSTSQPAAKVIRTALKTGLQNQVNQENDLLQLAKVAVTGGPKDLSKNLDRYLYGRTG